MRQRNALLMVGALAAALTVTPGALVLAGKPLGFVQPAQARTQIEISFFFDGLSPHGTWVRHAAHGYVFVPAAGRGWRPYVHGHWVYTDQYGWYWVSEEPFSWAVYHYGRWGYDPAYGWFWVPGTVWAPAWVTWRHGGGHVGWAPLAPHGGGYAIGYVDYYEPPIVEAWVFVPERRFLVTDVVQYVVPVVEINVILGTTQRRSHVQRRGDTVVNVFLDRNEAARIAGARVPVVQIAEADSPAQATQSAQSGATVRTFRPQVAENAAEEKPKKAVENPDQVREKPTLQQTAKGERPKDAPPSAAELKPGDSAAGAEEKGKAEAKPAQGEDKAKAETEAKPAQGAGKAKAETEAKPTEDKAKGTAETDAKPAQGEAKGEANADAKAKPAPGEGKAEAKTDRSEAKGKGKVSPEAEAKPAQGKGKAEAEAKPEQGEIKDKGKGKPKAEAKPEQGEGKAKAEQGERKAKAEREQPPQTGGGEPASPRAPKREQRSQAPVPAQQAAAPQQPQARPEPAPVQAAPAAAAEDVEKRRDRRSDAIDPLRNPLRPGIVLAQNDQPGRRRLSGTVLPAPGLTDAASAAPQVEGLSGPGATTSLAPRQF